MPRSFELYNVKKGRKVVAAFWHMDDAIEYKKAHRGVKIVVIKGKVEENVCESV